MLKTDTEAAVTEATTSLKGLLVHFVFFFFSYECILIIHVPYSSMDLLLCVIYKGRILLYFAVLLSEW